MTTSTLGKVPFLAGIVPEKHISAMTKTFLKTGLFIGFISILSHGQMNSLKGAVIAMHSGSANPTTEGFGSNGSAGSSINGDNDGAVSFDAFQVIGASTAQYFDRSLTASETNGALSAGWKMTVNMRLPQGGSLAYAGFFDSTRRWDLFISGGVTSDQVILWDGTNGLSGGPSYNIPGATGKYRFLELIYNASTSKANFYVDGVLAVSDFTGGPASTTRLAYFGSTNSVPANFNLYKIETGAFDGSAYPSGNSNTVPEPGALVLAGGGLLAVWLRHRG